MTSPTSVAPATPRAPRPRLHWSVAAPLSAAAGVGSAVLGVLVDLPLLGLAGAVVAAVPAVLAARRVPALQAEVERSRAGAPAAAVPAAAPALPVAAAPAEPLVDVVPVRPFVAATAPTAVPVTVDLVRAERPAPTAPAVDLVKPSVPVPAPVGEPQHATVGATRPASAASVETSAQDQADEQAEAHARVDTAELQLIWDLGEASRARSGRGRRARTGAEVDALPDRLTDGARSTAPSPRRRARHRA